MKIENKFIIDLSNAKDTLEIINELSNILEMSNSKNKNICLKLRDVELSQSQLLSIRALINASDSKLVFIDTNSEKTISSAEELGINISTISIDDSDDQEDKNINKEYNNEDVQPLEADTNNENNEHLDNIITNDLPAFNQLFSPQEEAVETNSELPYEIFKNENMEEDENKELPTLYIKQTLRSGQTISYDGNILIIGDTHPGTEVIAKGDITVWGVLGGIAHAGTSGNKKAKIRALKLNGIQLRIAGIYAARANTENIPHIQRTNEFTPQEAKIENDTIVIKSINNDL